MTHDEVLRLVTRAIRATLEGDSSVVDELFAPDVHASLVVSVWSAPALAVEIEDRAGAFEDVDLHVARSSCLGEQLWVEWTASVVHVGPFAVDDVLIPASGRRTELCGVTVAEVDDDRIVGFRQYWDCAALMGRTDPPADRRPRRGRRQRG